jgi:uncharacterized membrane protein
MREDPSIGHHVGPDRLLAIDPLRGGAMVLVIVQHAYHFVDPAVATPLSDTLVYGVTRTALVAFVALSGTMLAYFMASAREGAARRSPAAVAARYRRRALFILCLAHPAIQVARMANLDDPGLGVWGQLVQRLLFDFPITDTIALCLLVAPPILSRLRSAWVSAVAAGLLLATLGALIAWHPESAVGRALEAGLFGTTTPDPVVSVGWPFVPWLGVFLLGAWPGELLAAVRTGRTDVPTVVGRLLRAAAWLGALGVALSAGYKVLRRTQSGVLDDAVFRVLYPDCTTGLLPLYLAGLAVLLAGLLWSVDVKRRYDRALWALSVFGRTSLFTYVVQFVFVHSIPAALGLRHRLDAAGVAALAVVAIGVTGVFAWAYGRFRGWIAPDDYAALRASQGRSPLTREPS